MKFLLKLLEKQDILFHKGGKLEKLFPLWDAQSTFLFTPAEVTEKGPHVRDSIDLKRLMITVVMIQISGAMVISPTMVSTTDATRSRATSEPWACCSTYQ